MRLHFPSILVAFFLCLVLPTSAHAETDLAIMLYPNSETASPDAVTAAVGSATFDLACPEQREHIEIGSDVYDKRGVRIHLKKTGVAYRQLPVLNALLNDAIQMAQSQCQLTMDGPNGPYDRGDVAFADIYARPQSGMPETLVARARDYYPLYGYWERVVDIYADKEQAKADREERAAALSKSQADAVGNATAPVRSFPVGDPAAQQAQRSHGDDLGAKFFAFLWRWTKIIGGGWLAIWLFNRRDKIAEWYFSLSPHPATSQVNDAINRGLPIDGNMFAVVNQPFDGNRYETNVRSRQADALTQRLRRHEAALRTQSESILRKKREELLREQEFMRAHEALINAGVDHEVAAAHLEALRKATGQ